MQTLEKFHSDDEGLGTKLLDKDKQWKFSAAMKRLDLNTELQLWIQIICPAQNWYQIRFNEQTIHLSLWKHQWQQNFCAKTTESVLPMVIHLKLSIATSLGLFLESERIFKRDQDYDMSYLLLEHKAFTQSITVWVSLCSSWC